MLLTAQTSPTIAAGLFCHAKVVPSDIKIWSVVPIASSCFKLLALPCHKLPYVNASTISSLDHTALPSAKPTSTWDNWPIFPAES